MNQFFKNPKFRKVGQWTLLLVAISVLVFSLYWFVSDFQSLMRSGNIQPIRHRLALNVSTPDQIRGWMTFKYVNLVFKLPQNYLKTALNITDSRYPNMLIGSLAKQQKKTPSQVLLSVQQAVKNYSAALQQ